METLFSPPLEFFPTLSQWRVEGIILEQLLLQNGWLVGGPPATKQLAT